MQRDKLMNSLVMGSVVARSSLQGCVAKCNRYADTARAMYRRSITQRDTEKPWFYLQASILHAAISKLRSTRPDPAVRGL